MYRKKQATFLRRLTAILSCFILVVTAMSPVTARASTTEALSLKYNGKAVVLEKPDGSIASYQKLKKVFGNAAKKYELNGMTAYKCKRKGFSLLIEPWGDDSLHGYSVTVKITAKKVSLNGIKVGMSYNSVKNALEKNYGKSNVIAQENEIQLINVANSFIQYLFENGKVSQIEFFHS